MNTIGKNYRQLKITEAMIDVEKQKIVEQLLNFYYSVLIRYEAIDDFTKLDDLRVLRSRVITHEVIPSKYEKLYRQVELLQAELFNIYTEIYYLMKTVMDELVVSEREAEQHLNRLMWKIDQEEHDRYCDPRFAPTLSKSKSPRCAIHY